MDVRRQYDVFCEDVSYGRPATGISTEYFRSRMADFAEVLHCKPVGLDDLIQHCTGDSETAEEGVVDAKLTVELFQCITKLLYVHRPMRTEHPALNRYLRSMLAP